MYPRLSDLINDIFGTGIILPVQTYGFFVALAFLGVLLWHGGKTALKSIMVLEHASTQWGPPIFPFKVMLPLGALLLILQLTAKFIRDLRTLFTGKENK